MTAAEIDRYLAKVEIRGEDECWPWLASLNRYGYGQFRWTQDDGHSTVSTSHRFGYELKYGPIPEGYEPDHRCETTWCQNPFHMEAVPKAVNTARGNVSRARRRLQVAIA